MSPLDSPDWFALVAAVKAAPDDDLPRLVAADRVADPAEQVWAWVIEGQRAGDIRQAIAAKFPAADPAALVVGVMERLKDAADFEPDVVVGWAFEATKELYRRSLAAGDFAAALRAVKQMADLAGKHVPNRQPEPREAEAEAEPEDGAAG